MHKLVISLLLVAVALTGCVKLDKSPIDKRYYRIVPERTAPASESPRDIVLRVRRMTISDLYSTRELVYQHDSGRIESDFYNMFFVMPANMLTSELRKWLIASGQFSQVVEPGSLVIPGLTLEGTVNALYGDFSGDTPEAVVSMQFFLLDESTIENVVVFSRSYDQRIPLAQADPHHLVQAMTTGVQRIFTQFESDLAQAPLK